MPFISLQEVAKRIVTLPFAEFKTDIDHAFVIDNMSDIETLANELLKQLPGLINRHKYQYVCEVYDQLAYFHNQKNKKV